MHRVTRTASHVRRSLGTTPTALPISEEKREPSQHEASVAVSRKHERRLQRFLQKQKLLFVRVGARFTEDHVISTLTEVDGATRSNREYSALIRDIVACVLGDPPSKEVHDEK